jgi:hypothetical protein
MNSSELQACDIHNRNRHFHEFGEWIYSNLPESDEEIGMIVVSGMKCSGKMKIIQRSLNTTKTREGIE